MRSSRSRAPPTRPSAAPSSTTFSAASRRAYPQRPAGPRARRSPRRGARTPSRRSRRPFRSSTPNGGRASSASPPPSWRGSRSGGRRSARVLRRSARARCPSRSPTATPSPCARAPTGSSERRDGTFAIIDFKTGQPPGLKEVFAGFSPQLTLEAVMLMEGAFDGLPAARGDARSSLRPHLGRAQAARSAPHRARRRARRAASPRLVAEHRRRFEGMIARYASGEIALPCRGHSRNTRGASPITTTSPG